MASSSKSANKEIISGDSFTPSKDIKYSKPKVNASGGKSIGILNGATNSALYISTPLMMTWGVNEYEDKKSNEKTYSMSLQFPGDEYSTKAIEKFRTNFVDFEKKIKEDALTNQKEWFGKTNMKSETIDILWSPMLNYTKDKETGEPDLTKNPTIRLKMPIWEGVWNIELYDPSGKKLFPDPNNDAILPSDLIAKGSQVAVVMQCGGIWFAGGKFGVTWKLFQAVVKPKSTLKGKCHILLSSEEKQKVETQEIDPTSDDDVRAPVTATEDSDDEESAPVKVQVAAKVVEPEPEPVSEAPAVKKVVKKVVKKA